MKGLLKKLEKSKFIDDIHKQALWVDTVTFMKLIKETPDLFEYTKSYDVDLYEPWDLRVKFNFMISGFYQYVKYYIAEHDASELMLSCDIDDRYTLVAFTGPQNLKKIIAYHLHKYQTLPVHTVEINLDYDTDIIILMYDDNFIFPGFELN